MDDCKADPKVLKDFDDVSESTDLSSSDWNPGINPRPRPPGGINPLHPETPLLEGINPPPGTAYTLSFQAALYISTV